METELCYFTIPQIVELVEWVVLVGCNEKCLWSKLLEYISNLSTETQNQIRCLASEQSAMGKKRKAHDDRTDNRSRKKPQGRQAPSHVTDMMTWSTHATISSTQHEVDVRTDNETRIDEDNIINELINGPFLQNARSGNQRGLYQRIYTQDIKCRTCTTCMHGLCKTAHLHPPRWLKFVVMSYPISTFWSWLILTQSKFYIWDPSYTMTC